MIALSELLLGNKKRAEQLSKELLKHTPEHQLEQDFLLLDLAKGRLSPEAAQELIVNTAPKREELPERIEQFEKLVQENPKSAILTLHLASLWTEYGKIKEAIPLIESVALFDETPPSLHYDLASLYYERFDLAKAHYHAQKALLKAKKNGLVPKPILQLILKIQKESPDSPNL
jgi:predicted Zn-dependent protease